MTSREDILNGIKKLDQPKVEINSTLKEQAPRSALLSVMTEKLLSVGATVIVFEEMAALTKYVVTKSEESGIFVNAVLDLPQYNVLECLWWSPIELSSVKRFIVKGNLGIAESGAIWVSEENMQVRLLPFICKQLFIVLREDDLVFDLEEGYEKLGVLEDAYGVFLAGPSKTADIEQSLVIGAHGPIDLSVLIIKENTLS